MSTRVVIEEIAATDREVIQVEGERVTRRGNSLAELIRQIGGYEGELVQPSTGTRFPVSLERWRGRDPESTWLVVYFHIEPPDIDVGVTDQSL